MNTYSKYCPNVFLAKCEEIHQPGAEIEVSTKYGNAHECIVYNLIYSKDGYHYHSVVRADGFNAQERARRKAERLSTAAANAEKRSTAYWKASHEGHDVIPLGQPILVGHHSEKKHRALIARNHARMNHSVEEQRKAEAYAERVSYWEAKAGSINLSMPESIEFYEHKLEQATREHEGLKNGTIQRSHSFSLTYAKKAVNEAKKNLELARQLWEIPISEAKVEEATAPVAAHAATPAHDDWFDGYTDGTGACFSDADPGL